MADDKKKIKNSTKSSCKKERLTKAYKPGKFCLKMRSGVKLAEHKDRRSCGKCGYFEKK